MTRRHGWQRPLHPLQIVGMVIYSVLVMAFYTFLGLFLGNQVAVITVISLFSFVAFSVMVFFIRCTAIDPTDKTSSKKKKRAKSKGVLKLSFKIVMSQFCVRFFRRIERKILRNFIRRTYLDPWKSTVQLEPLLPFPLVMNDDAITPNPKEEEDDISYCSLCDLEVKRSSKHCRTCDRCVEGFDHHCRVLLVLLTAYGSAAMGQLFFFHVVLIRKGMRTYDYILAMREENQLTEVDPFDDFDSSSDESSDFDSPCSTPAPVAKLQVSPGRFSSPRRRFSGSSGMSSSAVPSPKQKYRSNFDLKLTEVSKELENYISRQVLCSVIKQDGSEASPR